ncbi:exodeoxyribonuclease V subunit beta [Nocardioides seonyuensis]|uniref:RecBCD enzyme subunit RecB n=1 Tax=Nocardioides seonyuensis TaxID=2518371 RepID=A0A4P7IHG3_9ACTN|nr:UvrD-helicase domain-containing protein [Nocardioides seonyuensis]QBX55221.1 exodeoxyribonuclease V subunit beta [Nocardioides seonyuensis]
MDVFDITAPLPQGPTTTLLEASAGTGKTWTIAALVTRYVAEGVARLDELLVVTFTRAASQELRERVRAQLTTARDALAGDSQSPPADAMVEWLLDADESERARRLARLTAALTDFDAATIATIHQFCQLVLRSLGVAGDTDTDARLVEDLEQLTHEVVDDLFLASFADLPAPPWSHDVALQIGRAVVDDPRAAIEPRAALTEAPDSTAAARVRFGTEVLAEVERRKRRLGVLSYDDLLSQLADALDDPRSDARARMRRRWKVALIDEFQDTDPVQWQVFERAFHAHSTLVLIGDPKQAIYAFRGGDVVTYLRAAEVATTRQTLGVNWRADGPVLASLQALMRDARLGSDEIVVLPVAADRDSSRLEGAGPPFRLRVVRRAELGLGLGPKAKPPRVDVWRRHVTTDLAQDIKRLLLSGAKFCGRDLEPSDVAVLAARRSDLTAAQEALAAVGVRSVINAGGSVFHTPAATEWLVLLEALEQPHRTARVRAAALTSFVGLDAAALDAGGPDLTNSLTERLRALSDILATRGVAAVLEATVIDGLTDRVLSRLGGERTLTDLHHIGEALHRVSVDERLGPVGLLAWLRQQVADEKKEVAGERTRRLDSDADAVQLVTIHGSKGLQYPVVYAPTLWDRWTGRDPDVLLFHDDQGRRCRDIGGPSPARKEHLQRHWTEDAGESLRLLYVALTRAQSQVVAWYAPTNNTAGSPLHRMLFGRLPGGAAVPDSAPLPDDDKIVTVLGHWKHAGGPQPELATLVAPDVRPLEPSQDALSVRVFDREIDTAWRRTSYSSLSAAAGTSAIGDATTLSEPEEVPGLEVEEPLPTPEESADETGADLAAVPSPMAGLPVGATFGSLVHAVLEHADVTATDLRAELVTRIQEQVEWWAVPGLDVEELADALVAVCDSPLGPLAGGATLRDVTRADRLEELDFELPLAGGDDADATPGSAVLGDVAVLLRRHLPEGDPVRSYADTLDADPVLAAQVLRGYLTGSIDVVMRREVDGATRFLTVDYKTNWLGEVGAPLTAHDYRPAVLDEAMGHSDYPLQALLYTVVLHRFLRWRLADYDPEAHLGGVLYLYLRGMCGPETPLVDGSPCGVFSWRPPVALVTELSDLLDGRLQGRLAGAVRA